MNALLGGIIGGALEQGGKAAYRSIAEDAELERKMTMENHRSKIEEDRAMRLEAIRGAREDKNYLRTRADTVTDKGEERTYQLGRDRSTTDLQKEIAKQSQDATAEQGRLNREAQAAQSAASRAQSASQHTQSLAAQRGAQGTLQTGEDGNVYRILDGKASQVMDGDKPMRALKGTSESTLRQADVFISASKDTNLSAEERAGAREMATMILSGGKAEGPKRTPTAEQIKAFQKVAEGDPNAQVSFGQTFGPEHLKAAMSGASKKTDPAAPPGAAPSKPVIGSNPEYEAAVAARLAERQARTPANPALEAQNAAAGAQIQARKEAEAAAAAKLKEVKARMATVSSMSPAEAAKMLEEDGPRLSVNERAKLQARANR